MSQFFAGNTVIKIEAGDGCTWTGHIGFSGYHTVTPARDLGPHGAEDRDDVLESLYVRVPVHLEQYRDQVIAQVEEYLGQVNISSFDC